MRAASARADVGGIGFRNSEQAYPFFFALIFAQRAL
jgi:hypothetical protein